MNCICAAGWGACELGLAWSGWGLAGALLAVDVHCVAWAVAPVAVRRVWGVSGGGLSLSG